MSEGLDILNDNVETNCFSQYSDNFFDESFHDFKEEKKKPIGKSIKGFNKFARKINTDRENYNKHSLDNDISPIYTRTK